MNARLATPLVLALAACGGTSSPPAHVAGSAPAVATPSATTTAPADPTLGFRRAYADPGGMWLPQQMTLPAHADALSKLGVTLDPKVLSDPLSAPLAAVVWLQGCTASFVSPEGLTVTNHHCVQAALQRNSTASSNLVEDGFLAKTRADERPAGPAQRILVAQAFRDVTREMRDGLAAITDAGARQHEAEKRLKDLVAACENGRPNVRCQVSSFFDGGLYELIEMLEIKDVRLVYVPARSVGNYGGEVDNFGWPRHTGDFAFYRAYVGADGKPAEYSADNVPYQPAHYLKVSTAGLAPADFVMVTGYPGRTSRTHTASEIRGDVEFAYPARVAALEEQYALFQAHLADGGETAIKATTSKQRVQNTMARFRGILDGVAKGNLLAQKDDLDRKVKAWAAQPGNEAYARDVARLEAIVAERRATERVDFDRGNAFDGSRLLATAFSLVRWAEERGKKDADRKVGFQDRDLPRALAGQKQLTKAYDRALDRGGLRLAVVRALRLDEAQRGWLATLLGAKPGQKVDEALVDATLDAWYGSALLESEDVRTDLLRNATPLSLRASKDPFVRAALRAWPTVDAEETKQDAYAGELIVVRPGYTEALKQVLGGMLAPDANQTLRVTYGTVKSLAVADSPFTIASQIVTKDTGKEPFDAPPKLLDAIRARRYGAYADPALGGELPVDFLSDVDITGGNSGSPTLNAKGELVGLAFDGNIQGVASDILFDGTTTRAIHVDARYMIWMMDVVDGAKDLVREMGLTPSG
jgi:hypothetical protein